MATIVRHEKFIKSDLNKNNNKFWEIEIYDNGDVLCKWGRVGDTGQSKSFSMGNVSSANSFADKKIHEKTSDGRNGEIAYRKIEIVGSITPTVSSVKSVNTSELQRIASSQIKTNNPIVDDLVKYLTKVNAHQITSQSGGKITYNDTTGLFSTPLGIVTQSNIDEANNILIKIGDIVANNKYNDKNIIPFTNDYLMLIPHDFGRNRLDPREFWCSLQKVQEEKALLDGLQTSYLSATTNPKMTTTPDKPMEKVFDLQLNLVDDKAIIKFITDKYEKTKKDMHVAAKYRVKQIYSVRIGGERERFESQGKPIGNVNQFWHGSNSSNLLSIMKQGLVVPPASSPHVCGRMFGGGAYFAPSSSKSLNYSIGVWHGQNTDRVFMFMADVAMGKSYVPRSSSDGPFPKPGYDSVWAKAGQSGVMNDECIIYNLKQCTLTHLLELTTK